MHKATIRSPRRNQRVDRREILSGRIIPPSPVQALVKARDGKWYLQAPSVNRGTHWSIPVFFGFEDAPDGTMYEVVVVKGCNTIKESPLEAIPEGVEIVAETVVERRLGRGNTAADGDAFPTD